MTNDQSSDTSTASCVSAMWISPRQIHDFLSRLSNIRKDCHISIFIPGHIVTSVNEAFKSNQESIPIALSVSVDLEDVTFLPHVTEFFRTNVEGSTFAIEVIDGESKLWPSAGSFLSEIEGFLTAISSNAYVLDDGDTVVGIADELEHCIELMEYSAKAKDKVYGYMVKIIEA